MFSVVHFYEDNSVAVVPENWITTDIGTRQTQCVWPNEKNMTKIEVLVKKGVLPGKNWKLYEIRVLKTYGKEVQVYTVFYWVKILYFLNIVF